MKKLLYLLVIFLLPALSGCGTSVGTGVFFGGPGWGWGGPSVGTNIFFYPQIDRSTLTPEDIQLLNNVKTTAIKNGYTVIDANTKNTIGFRASKHIDDITNNDVTGLPSFIVKDGPRFITVKNGKIKDTYKIRAIVDLTNMNSPRIASPIAYSPDNINVRMDLPGKIMFNNAQKKCNNGKTLEWKLISGEKNLIEANFEIHR